MDMRDRILLSDPLTGQSKGYINKIALGVDEYLTRLYSNNATLK